MAKMHEAILHIYPKAEFTFLEEDYTTLQWYSEEFLKPTLGDIIQAGIEVDRLNAIAEIEAEYFTKIAVVKEKLFDAMMLDDQITVSLIKIEYAQLKKELEDKKAVL